MSRILTKMDNLKRKLKVQTRHMTADNEESDQRATTDEKVYSKSRRTIRYFVLVVKPLARVYWYSLGLSASKNSIRRMIAHLKLDDTVRKSARSSNHS